MIETILANAKQIEDLQAEVDRTFASRAQSGAHVKAWKKAANRFHDEYSRLAFPGGLARAYDLIKARDPSIAEPAIAFLEADPFFFGSGYIKADLLKVLKAFDLSSSQKARLRRVILDRVKGPPRREFRKYCNLAKGIATPGFVTILEGICANSDGVMQHHAHWVLAAIAKA